MRSKSVARASKREAKLADAMSAKTNDSFVNFFSRIGQGSDNQASLGTMGFNPITRFRVILDWAYRGSWICRKTIKTLPEDMTRAGFDLGSDIKPEYADLIHTSFGVKFQLWEKLCQTMQWARLYGGAIAIMLIDGQDPKDPLKLDSIEKDQFCGLAVLDRWQLDPTLNELVTDLRSHDLGKPKYYRVNADAPFCARKVIHHTRILRFEGDDLPYYQKLAENMWGLSVLEPIWDRVLAFDSTTAGTSQLVYRAHMRTLSIKGLRTIIAAGGDILNALLEQVELMRRYQGIEGISVLDAEDKFENYQYTFSGLDTVLLQMGQQLSGAIDIPLVRLFGQSPVGLNATGESDFRNYYDGINARQNKDLRPQINRLLPVVCKSEGIILPDNFNYGFASLWQMSDQEKSQVGSTVTNAVLAALSEQVISKSVALKELRSVSKNTGMWTNISDEDIKEAEAEPPIPEMPEAPAPDQFLPGANLENTPQDELDQDSKVEFLPGSRKRLRLKKIAGGGFVSSELERSDSANNNPLVHTHLEDQGK